MRYPPEGDWLILVLRIKMKPINLVDFTFFCRYLCSTFYLFLQRNGTNLFLCRTNRGICIVSWIVSKTRSCQVICSTPPFIPAILLFLVSSFFCLFSRFEFHVFLHTYLILQFPCVLFMVRWWKQVVMPKFCLNAIHIWSSVF